MTSYASLAEIKAALADVSLGTEHDMLLQTLAARASRLIDTYTRRRPNAFAADTITTHTYNGNGKQLLEIDELAEWPVVKVEMSGEEIDGTQLMPYPPNHSPYTHILIDKWFLGVWVKGTQNIKITGKWGYSTVPPEPIVQATIILVARWLKRGQQAFQDVGAIAELGQLKYVRELDPEIKMILDSYQRLAI